MKNPLNSALTIQVFTAVLVVLTYSIALILGGMKYERTQLSSSVAAENRELLKKNEQDNVTLKLRQVEIQNMLCEALADRNNSKPPMRCLTAVPNK